MDSFPLYTIAYDATCSKKNTHLNPEEKDFFINKLANLDTNVYELLYVLIRAFTNNSIRFPFNSTQLKRGIRFDLDKLPAHLQQILFYFLNIHLSSVKN